MCVPAAQEIMAGWQKLYNKHFHIIVRPWNRFLLDKLTGSQLVRKFPAFYGTQKFITVLTKAGHLSLS